MHAKKATRTRRALWCLPGLVAAALLLPAVGWAAIDGVSGSSFALTARDGYISTPDGGSIYSWGFAASGGAMQLPGPTLIVNEGATVTVSLTNALPSAAGNVSIVFPGQSVTSSGGVAGLLTREAAPGGLVQYEFTATRPGTFLYHSGTRPDLQIEMGLFGALIVRPTGGTACTGGGSTPAYNNAYTCYDREYLFLLSEVDIDVHVAVEGQAFGPGPVHVPTSPHEPEYWMINGRAAPDTMAMAGTGTLAHQPYNCMPRMEPGERVLLRVVGAGRDAHPYHHHGNHTRLLARDANLLASPSGALLGPRVFTTTAIPGGTADAIFEWTGQGLGWDIYGHAPGDAMEPGEWGPDHGVEIPVDLPDGLNVAVGGFWSGSPHMGAAGTVPPGEGGLNPNAGFTFMWHSHNEREMVNNDVFPGGMMTMLVVEPPGTLAAE